MSQIHSGNIQPYLDYEEHDGANNAKRVIIGSYKFAGSSILTNKYFAGTGAQTDSIVWSPAVGKRWYITDIFIAVSAAATVTLEDDLVAGDNPVWSHAVAANSGWDHTFQTPLFSGEDGADLMVTTNTGNITITITGYEV